MRILGELIIEFSLKLHVMFIPSEKNCECSNQDVERMVKVPEDLERRVAAVKT